MQCQEIKKTSSCAFGANWVHINFLLFSKKHTIKLRMALISCKEIYKTVTVNNATNINKSNNHISHQTQNYIYKCLSICIIDIYRK